VPSVYIVDLHVAVNCMKPVGFAVETQEWVSFALLSNLKIFHAVNSMYFRRSSCDVSDTVVRQTDRQTNIRRGTGGRTWWS